MTQVDAGWGKCDSECKRCEGIGWVCENHPNVPWAGMTGEPFCRSNVEGCGGAGMPCPDCHVSPPRIDN